jgi:MYXO-CTERM domain-containing protein
VGTTVNFAVEAGQYFGFYIDANGHTSSQGVYYSESFRNTDGDGYGVETDHFLMFESDAGLLIAMEDLAYNHHAGRMGDQDYQDTVVLLTYADGSAVNLRVEVPEPSSALAGLAGIALLLRRPRRRNRIHAAS